MWHHGVTLWGVFFAGFTDRANIILLRQRTLSTPINLEIIVHNVTPKITRARSHLKHLTLAEHFSGLKILWMHNKYAFGRFEVIYAPQTQAC